MTHLSLEFSWCSRYTFRRMFYRGNTSQKWDISPCGEAFVYHDRALNNYFMPCHRIYSQVANTIIMTNTRLDVIPSYVQRLSCILIGCILNDMAWILIMECFRVPYRGISHGLLKCFWCAHEKIHVKTRYWSPYQKKALHNYSILNHATEITQANMLNTANDKDWVNTSPLMFFEERNPTI